jgi:hypothetical protein
MARLSCLEVILLTFLLVMLCPTGPLHITTYLSHLNILKSTPHATRLLLFDIILSYYKEQVDSTEPHYMIWGQNQIMLSRRSATSIPQYQSHCPIQPAPPNLVDSSLL